MYSELNYFLKKSGMKGYLSIIVFVMSEVVDGKIFKHPKKIKLLSPKIQEYFNN